MYYIMETVFGIVVLIGIFYIISLFRDPRRKMDSDEHRIYERFEKILEIYPKNRFFGTLTNEESWFVSIREGYISIVRGIKPNLDRLNSQNCHDYRFFSGFQNGYNTVYTDTYFYIAILGSLYESIHGYHSFNESFQLRLACQADLQARFYHFRKEHPIDPVLIDHFGEQYIELITTPSNH